MGNLLKKPFRRAQDGLTLIEVMIALAIVAIALTAIIKATMQTMHATGYLQDKTMAMWLAEEKMHELQIGLMPDKTATEHSQAETMLNHKWYWQASIQKTPNARVNKIIVRVYREQDTDHQDPLLTMEGYRYQTQS